MRKLGLEELNRVGVEEYKSQLKFPVVVILDNIRSGNNVGAFFRCCDAFKIDKLYLSGITPCPPHKEITKSAIGATSSVTWTYEESVEVLCQQLKTQSYQIIGIEQTSESVALEDFKFDIDQKYALIFGNEVSGISDSILHLLDGSIEIVQFGTKHSINVSVCGGIILHYFASQFNINEAH